MANYKSEIFEFPMMLSTFGLITNNAHGIQTGQSLLARYKVLDQELTARGVPRPVVELSDNHESRFDPQVMAFCAEKKIRQFFEPPKTSNYLQALDQFNKKFAEAYTKEKKRYLQEKKDAHESYSLSTSDFYQICLSIWPAWSTPSDRRRAFRKVGLSQVGINASNVNRSAFHMMPP